MTIIVCKSEDVGQILNEEIDPREKYQFGTPEKPFPNYCPRCIESDESCEPAVWKMHTDIVAEHNNIDQLTQHKLVTIICTKCSCNFCFEGEEFAALSKHVTVQED